MGAKINKESQNVPEVQKPLLEHAKDAGKRATLIVKCLHGPTNVDFTFA